MDDRDSSTRTEPPPDRREVGLCATCRHLRAQDTRRGSVFYRCALAEHDARYLRYPPLPVLRCAGHRPPDAAPRDPVRD